MKYIKSEKDYYDILNKDINYIYENYKLEDLELILEGNFFKKIKRWFIGNRKINNFFDKIKELRYNIFESQIKEYQNILEIKKENPENADNILTSKYLEERGQLLSNILEQKAKRIQEYNNSIKNIISLLAAKNLYTPQELAEIDRTILTKIDTIKRDIAEKTEKIMKSLYKNYIKGNVYKDIVIYQPEDFYQMSYHSGVKSKQADGEKNKNFPGNSKMYNTFQETKVIVRDLEDKLINYMKLLSKQSSEGIHFERKSQTEEGKSKQIIGLLDIAINKYIEQDLKIKDTNIRSIIYKQMLDTFINTYKDIIKQYYNNTLLTLKEIDYYKFIITVFDINFNDETNEITIDIDIKKLTEFYKKIEKDQREEKQKPDVNTQMEDLYKTMYK